MSLKLQTIPRKLRLTNFSEIVNQILEPPQLWPLFFWSKISLP